MRLAKKLTRAILILFFAVSLVTTSSVVENREADAAIVVSAWFWIPIVVFGTLITTGRVYPIIKQEAGMWWGVGDVFFGLFLGALIFLDNEAGASHVAYSGFSDDWVGQTIKTTTGEEVVLTKELIDTYNRYLPEFTALAEEANAQFANIQIDPSTLGDNDATRKENLEKFVRTNFNQVVTPLANNLVAELTSDTEDGVVSEASLAEALETFLELNYPVRTDVSVAD